MPTAALAQQTTLYGPDGKVTGRATTDSHGTTTIYDAAGRVTGRTATDSQGTTTIYDASDAKLVALRRAGGNDAYAMDAVCLRSHRVGDNDADGGRAMMVSLRS